MCDCSAKCTTTSTVTTSARAILALLLIAGLLATARGIVTGWLLLSLG
ncbi:hypothetical protein [Viridibacterium curvum]